MRRLLLLALWSWASLAGTAFSQPAPDPLMNGVVNGALVGAGAAAALFQFANQACGRGCENDIPPGAALLTIGALGGGLGSLAGMVIDRDADSWPRATSRHFAARPAVRVGPDYTYLAVRSGGLRGSAPTAGFRMAVQMSPHISGHIEYMPVSRRFLPLAGSVPDSILLNVVPATSRVAGRSYGAESLEIRSQVAGLVGFTPPPWGRLRVNVLAGVGVQSRVDRDYYDAWRDVGQGTAANPSGHERLPGKYYVLDFTTPKTGGVFGVDAEVALVRRLSVVPSLRYSALGGDNASVGFGVGAHWRF